MRFSFFFFFFCTSVFLFFSFLLFLLFFFSFLYFVFSWFFIYLLFLLIFVFIIFFKFIFFYAPFFIYVVHKTHVGKTQCLGNSQFFWLLKHPDFKFTHFSLDSQATLGTLSLNVQHVSDLVDAMLLHQSPSTHPPFTQGSKGFP